ncbi:MAG: FMN-binding protein [Solirubrobacteraceae bacterium]
MARAPYVLAATVAGTAALVSFHPHRPAKVLAAAPAAAAGAGTGGRTVSGSAEANPYGTVQVRIAVKAGKVTDVVAIQLPQNDPRSSEISAYAAPLLRQEALKAQSASIDAISGATYTSAGYQASLQAALSAAGI